jgi:DnaJ-class molecular chaperone
MNRRHFLAAVPGIAVLTCAREERRAERYDPHECPFCVVAKGTCTYCKGTKQCSFCKGTGKRVTVIPDLPEKGIRSSSYEEECPYCAGKGQCTYCGGSGVCWACKGSGRIESWNFYSKGKKGRTQ